jgi:hypothetical protein
MSTLSPTVPLARASASCTLDEYLQPFGPVNAIDGVVGLMAVIVAVMVTSLVLAPPRAVQSVCHVRRDYEWTDSLKIATACRQCVREPPPRPPEAVRNAGALHQATWA